MRKIFTFLLLLWMVPILSEGTAPSATGSEPGLGIPESPGQSSNPIQRELPEVLPDKERTLDLKTAEEKLWRNNLLLLASRFNIDARKAGIEQAGLYANPNIFIDQSIFAEPTQRYFDFTRSGQTVVQIQQLFLLGGKIGKRVRVAELNARMGEQEFYDLARELISKLRRQFYAIYYYRQAISFYDQSLEALGRTVTSAEMGYKRRAILQAEVLRLKALYFFLKKEREELNIRILEKEADLRVLLNDDSFRSTDIKIVPMIAENQLDSLEPGKLRREELLEVARNKRPDLKKAIQALRFEEANLELQHANAIPDLAFGPMYNRGGTAFQNYWGITAQLNIPIFDRNQGNIKASEKAILSRKQELKNTLLEVENDVAVSIETARLKDELYKKFRNTYTREYTDLSKDMILSYEKRYITILEFTDFFETYRSSVVEMLKLQTDRMDAIEGVNFSVGQGVLIPKLNQPAAEEK
ncbi:channel protein TolC [Leptospira yasudae]|uniref:Channel protein TolC n=1 Tax=Leptospira yasudae TaxID=2202201 RepID=A0ABX9M2D0_9LEPT|nr:TolC family protein [Leptospira yasudae]RHX79176.1 channel protein TolC [Leptospira yasudae]RHX93339.1 channel protein TolC [Leptospira yasudae]TGK24699.1 TolC family protein [Leptospira yasudae]TGM09416.1 TolC family protein [Leptospira yasudae]